MPSVSIEENPLIYYDIPGVYFEIENTLLLAYDPATIKFNHTNSIPGDYFWSFGDGTQAYVSSPVHTYPGEGSYPVTMQFENNCIELDTSFMVHVYTRPKPEFNVSDMLGCAPFTVSIDNLSPKNYTDLTWSAPGSLEGTSSLENPIFTYLTPGDYDISLSCFDNRYSSGRF